MSADGEVVAAHSHGLTIWETRSGREVGSLPSLSWTDLAASADGHTLAGVTSAGAVVELEGACGNAGYSSRVQCVAATSGAYDFVHFYEQTNGKSNSKRAQTVVGQLLGGRPDERPEAARSGSRIPMTFSSVGHGPPMAKISFAPSSDSWSPCLGPGSRKIVTSPVSP